MRTLSFFAPSGMENYWELDSEVPINPYPEAQDVEKMMAAKKPDEIELGEVIYTDKMSVKDLQLACKERDLPYTGSKRRLLDRLLAFKVNIENKLKLSIANKRFKERQRTPMTLGQPKLPPMKEQEAHFVTHVVSGMCCKQGKGGQP